MMMGGDIWSNLIGQNTEFFELNCGDMEELDFGGSLNNKKCRDKSYEDLVKIVGEQNAWYTSVGIGIKSCFFIKAHAFYPLLKI